MCLIPEAWEGTSSEELVMVDMKDEAGDIYEYKDRRQEIVIIGHRMKRDNIQGLLDKCLLTDEEMALGPEMWMETMGHLDVIRGHLGGIWQAPWGREGTKEEKPRGTEGLRTVDEIFSEAGGGEGY